MTTADDSPVPDYASLLRLDDKGFMVLGAGQGMGRQTAHALSQVGARVFCVDIDAERAEEVAAEVGGIAYTGDATTRDGMVALVRAGEEALGRIDGFVDIIGMAAWATTLEIDDETWDWQFDVVLRHAYLVSQLAGRRMAATGGGSMVFIASVSGFTSAPNHAAYGAAKAGLMAWMKSLAVELAPAGIRANCVAPGSIFTPRMQATFDAQKIAENNATVPLGAMGEPADIAGAALFLSTPLAKYITGRTIVVDGGVDVKFPYMPLSTDVKIPYE